MENNSSSDEADEKVQRNTREEGWISLQSSSTNIRRGAEQRPRRPRSLRRRFLQIGNISVSVVKGTLSDQTADVIVNSAAPDLDLNKGSVSIALLDAAGDTIQSECNTLYPSGIKCGDVAITGSGYLRCQSIFHVTLPTWTNQGDEQNVEHIVRSCLLEADKHGFTSVAFPAIGTGLLKYPTKTVASTMFDTVDKFAKSNKTSCVKVVNCVVYTDDTTKFQDFLDEAKTRAASRGIKEIDQTSLSTRIGNININISVGSIVQQTADVIVNSAASDLDLSKGSVSIALLDAAGDTIQSECNTLYPSGIKCGDVAITGSGYLRCQSIFHVTLPTWTNQGDEQNVEHIVRSCLIEADKHGFTSVAFPAIGTGVLLYPTKTVASTMFDTVEKFAKSNKTSCVKVVNCVVYTDDTTTFQDFLDEAKTRAASRGIKEMDLFTQTLLSTRIGNININISVGSIVQQTADVMVNSCCPDMELQARSGLSKTISEAAGSQLQDEINQNYPRGIQVGNLAITGGHAIKCKEIFHGTLTPFFAKRTGGYLPEQVLYNFVHQCLKEANNRCVKSISFPALGTGILKFPAKTAASIVIKAITDFQIKNPSSSIITIYIVIFGGTNDWASIEQAYVSEFNVTTGQQVAVTTKPDIPKRGTQNFLSHKYTEAERTPQYWTHFKSNQTIKEINTTYKGEPCKVVTMDSTSATYQSIATAFTNTHSGSSIVSIERIENILLFEKYIQECQRLFRKAFVNKTCTPLKDVPQSKGVASSMIHLHKFMTNDLSEEINELYLFHGTKVHTVDVILQQGLDDRLASPGRLGTGVYTADLASKSHGYTDPNQNGERKMFLMRVCLGDIFITTTQKGYKRPPCKQCNTDTCTNHPDLFDSVVAEFDAREFVVFDRAKCYPEYLITYQ